VSYRICSVGQAIKTLSSPQFSSTLTGRGTISILREVGATGIFGITTPFSMLGSPTEATLPIEPAQVPFAVRPWPIADRARADAAGALGCGPRCWDASARDAKDAARPGARHWRSRPKRLLDREQERESGREFPVEGKYRPAASARQNRRGVLLARSALVAGRFAIWVLGNATAGLRQGSLHTELTLIGRCIEVRRGTGLLPFECERSGNCGAPGLLISVLTRNIARRMFKTNIAPTRSRAERGHDGRAVRTRERAWLTLVLPLRTRQRYPTQCSSGSVHAGTDAPIFAAPNFQQGLTASYSR